MLKISVKFIVCFCLSVIATTFSTLFYSYKPYIGITIGTICLVSFGIYSRFLAKTNGYLIYYITSLLTVYFLSKTGPANDILVVGNRLGVIWFWTPTVVGLLILLLPAKWFNTND